MAEDDLSDLSEQIDIVAKGADDLLKMILEVAGRLEELSDKVTKMTEEVAQLSKNGLKAETVTGMAKSHLDLSKQVESLTDAHARLEDRITKLERRSG